MSRTELAALVLASTVLATGWFQIVRSRHRLPRMRRLLGRKPHWTRRAYLVRFDLWNLELLRVVVPGGTASLLAMLGAAYLVEVRGYPDLLGVGLFLSVSMAAVLTYLVARVRLTRRIGMSCPHCGRVLDGIMDSSGLRVLKTGRCHRCSTTLFRSGGHGASKRPS